MNRKRCLDLKNCIKFLDPKVLYVSQFCLPQLQSKCTFYKGDLIEALHSEILEFLDHDDFNEKFLAHINKLKLKNN